MPAMDMRSGNVANQSEFDRSLSESHPADNVLCDTPAEANGAETSDRVEPGPVMTPGSLPRSLELSINSSDKMKALQIARNLVAGGPEMISPQMRHLAKLAEEDLQRIAQSVPGGWANVSDIYPLSALQEGILFHCLLKPQSDAYIFSTLLEFES